MKNSFDVYENYEFFYSFENYENSFHTIIKDPSKKSYTISYFPHMNLQYTVYSFNFDANLHLDALKHDHLNFRASNRRQISHMIFPNLVHHFLFRERRVYSFKKDSNFVPGYSAINGLVAWIVFI